LNTDILNSEEMKEEICAYLSGEIKSAEAEKTDLLQKIDKWRRQRENVPECATKDFPWKDASNVSVPLSAMNTNTIAASMKAAFEGKKPFYTISANDLSQQDDAKCLEEFVDLLVESRFHLNLREVNNEIFYETSSLGFQFVHVPWIYDSYTYKRVTDGTLEEVEVVRKDGPGIVPYPYEQVYYRAHVGELQRAPWIGFKNLLTEQELRSRQMQGIYDDIDKILGDERDTEHQNLKDMQQRAGLNAEKTIPYEVFEIYLFWDVDNDGKMEDIRVWFEPSKEILLRAEYNELGVRPISCFKYMRYTKREDIGIGVGKMTEQLQDAMDALFNMAINSTHISSLQMFKSREGSGIGVDEPFYPFKKINCEDPRDFEPIAFPNTLPANLNMMGMVQQFADRFTGATNSMSGFPDTYAKTRATASGTMFLAQQGSRMFNAVTEGIEETYTEVGSFILFQLALHKDRVAKYELFPEDKMMRIMKILEMDPGTLPTKFIFQVRTTEVDTTEEAKRQKLLTKSQLYQLYGQNTFQMLQNTMMVAMQMQQPQIAQQMLQKIHEYTLSFIAGSQKLMEDIFKEFDTDADGYLPNVSDIRMMVELINIMREKQFGQTSNPANSGQSLPGPTYTASGVPTPGTVGGPGAGQNPVG
jgi:hypothetical protein